MNREREYQGGKISEPGIYRAVPSRKEPGQ
ncbi:hypothetical protein GGR03_003526 [Aurantimonas endophytica]|uniref:Uncharacterized protein n=1 Tax=Aurantimonas endophytica TaxID=1522175 RepID=A0A7W6HGC1_9HYPH|nr:hypothetical protein [Aurantimonas endophytica]